MDGGNRAGRLTVGERVRWQQHLPVCLAHSEESHGWVRGTVQARYEPEWASDLGGWAKDQPL
jgi:hypothetical protein